MSDRIMLEAPEGKISGRIKLNGSKSISNRALIIRALCEEHFDISNLSNADDTVTLDRVLKESPSFVDAGAGGTTFRFLTAYLSTRQGEFTLTGSERMKQRPIGILVDALRKLGADISYLGTEGYPPLKIRGGALTGGNITISGSISSQYLSALLMIGPVLMGGLTLTWTDTLVSRPYLMMTLKLMRLFGAEWKLEGNSVHISEGSYRPRDFYVEGDWSAASYYYSLAALRAADITLEGLEHDSTQGDRVIAEIMENLGVYTKFDHTNKSIQITGKGHTDKSNVNIDFLECPDLAQTVITAMGALQINGSFTGLQTLKIKETDRISALSTELIKFGINFGTGGSDTWDLCCGEAGNNTNSVAIDTYDDHRMAMAFAPLCLLFGPVIINDPDVVGKSYPAFWNDLESLGFRIRHMD